MTARRHAGTRDGCLGAWRRPSHVGHGVYDVRGVYEVWRSSEARRRCTLVCRRRMEGKDEWTRADGGQCVLPMDLGAE